MFPRSVKIGTIDYVAGQKKTIDIPRDGVITQINIRFQYTHDNAAAGPAGPFFQTLARLVRRVDVVIGGRDTVVSQSGEMLSARAQCEFGTPADGMADTVVLTNSGHGADDIGFHLINSGVELAPAPQQRTEIEVAEDILATYVGKYELTPDFALVVTLEDGALFTQATGQGKLAIFAESETKFFLKVVDAQISFTKDDSGAVTGLILHQAGANQPARRVGGDEPPSN